MQEKGEKMKIPRILQSILEALVNKTQISEKSEQISQKNIMRIFPGKCSEHSRESLNIMGGV